MATLLFKKEVKMGSCRMEPPSGPRWRFRLGVSHLLHLFTTASQLYLNVSIGIRFVSQRIHRLVDSLTLSTRLATAANAAADAAARRRRRRRRRRQINTIVCLDATRKLSGDMVLTRREKFLMSIVIGAIVIDANAPRERAPNKHRDRKGALNDVAELTDAEFKKRFRMNRNAFAGLLATIRHDLERNEKMAIRSSKEPVFPYLQLCICLRYLAGGSYLDIADVYKVFLCHLFPNAISKISHLVQVHESTVMPVVWRGAFAVVSTLS